MGKKTRRPLKIFEINLLKTPNLKIKKDTRVHENKMMKFRPSLFVIVFFRRRTLTLT